MAIKLYCHTATSILPLLRPHLPYSLSVYGTLLATPAERHRGVDTGISDGHTDHASSVDHQAQNTTGERTVWTTFSADVDQTQLKEPDVWTAIIAYPPPDRQIRIYNSLEHPSKRMPIQQSPNGSNEGVSSHSEAGGIAIELLEKGKQQVKDAIEAYIRTVDPGMTYIGKVHEMWLDVVEDLIASRAVRAAQVSTSISTSLSSHHTTDASGSSESNGTWSKDDLKALLSNIDHRVQGVACGWKKQGRYWIWCPPFYNFSSGLPVPYDSSANGGERKAGPEGYEVDFGRPEDLPAFDGMGAVRISGYYAARLPYSTVIRPNRADTIALDTPTSAFDEVWTPANSTSKRSDTDTSKSDSSSCDMASSTSERNTEDPAEADISPVRQPPVARILTHPDGGIGALFTSSAHQRRGLARWVVQEHLASGRGHILDAALYKDSLVEQTGADSEVENGTRLAGWTYAVVHENNRASMALWQSMGWKQVWRCASVYRTEADIQASTGTSLAAHR